MNTKLRTPARLDESENGATNTDLCNVGKYKCNIILQRWNGGSQMPIRRICFSRRDSKTYPSHRVKLQANAEAPSSVHNIIRVDFLTDIYELWVVLLIDIADLRVLDKCGVWVHWETGTRLQHRAKNGTTSS